MQRFGYRCWLLWVALITLLATGCAIIPEPIPEPVPEAVYFRSKDYVIYELKGGDTPKKLAQQYLGDPKKDWVIEEANKKKDLKPGGLAVIPLNQRNKGGVFENGVQQIPILCYHRFGNSCGSPLCVPAGIFERQMKYLKDNGYRVITPEQLLEFMEFRQQLPKKAVMITIDDGYRSVYNIAYPILKKYGFTATLFIYTDYVGVSSKAITWDQLREIKANGFTIGSHTMHHSDLSKQGDNESNEAYIQRLRTELLNSKRIIDKKLNQDTFFFAYPFGRANHVAMNMARQAGYRLAATVNRGGNPFFAHTHLLQRDQVLKRDMATFKSRLKTFQSLSLR